MVGGITIIEMTEIGSGSAETDAVEAASKASASKAMIVSLKTWIDQRLVTQIKATLPKKKFQSY